MHSQNWLIWIKTNVYKLPGKIQYNCIVCIVAHAVVADVFTEEDIIPAKLVK